MRYFLASKGFWLVLGAPLYYVLYQIGQVLWVRPGALGPDPAQALVTLLGEIALWMLILVLSVTPLRKVFQFLRLHGQRRAMGIACFGYALLHWLAYAALLLEWQWATLGDDLLKRPYISVGFLAGLILLAMAATSNDWSTRRLSRRWRQLHRWGYLAAALVILHVFWIARSNFFEIVIYALIVVGLLVVRWPWFTQKIKMIKDV